MNGTNDAAAVAMAREVERAGRRIDEVEKNLRGLVDAVALLARPAPGGPPVTSWLDPGGPANPARPVLGPDDVARMLDDLAGWLARVYLRYEGAALPTCWAWHPDVVEELLWLRGAHADAYEGRMASWQRAGDWHDRQRPGVVKRLRAVADSCELDRHRDGQDRARVGVIPPVPMADHLSQLAAAWVNGARTPDVTVDLLGEAARYDAEAAGQRR